MTKYIPVFFLLLAAISCTFSTTNSLSFDDKVATQAAVVMTATALDQLIKNPAVTLEPTTVTLQPTDSSILISTETPALVPTLDTEDPVKSLGQPSWKDDLTNAGNWFSSGSYTSDNTKFKPSGGGITASSTTTSDGLRWYLYYEKKPKDLYVEGKFDISGCSGKDQYGIVFRAPNMQDGYAYFYGFTCDGGYILRKWDASGLSVVVENTTVSSINSGANKSNILGVWAKDDRIRLYANGQFLKEISNSSLNNDGHIGLFINARETPGLTIKLDEISYWLIN